MIASPSGGHTLNLTKYQDAGSVLQNFNETYTAGEKSDEETVAKEAEGIVGMLVGTDDIMVKPSASAENFSASLTLNRNNVPASAYTVLVNRAPVTFTGSSTTISMTSVDGKAQADDDPDDAGSALLIHGERGDLDGAFHASDTTLVSFGTATTTLETTMKGAKAGSTNVLHLEGNSAVAFTGKTVNISAYTESNAVAGAEHRGETPATGIGIVLEAYTGADSAKTADTANIRTGKDTTLNISVTGTGTTAPTTDNLFQEGGAAFLSGIYAEGGEIYAQGDVNIDVQAKGGTAIGTMLYARALDHSDLSKLNDKTWEFTDFGKTVSYDHTSTFEKSLTLNVSSDTGRAVGMILAGSCCNLEGVNGKWEDEDGYTDNRHLNATTKVTVNDLTVNVKKGDANKFASDGILMVGTRVGGNTELVVNGNATVTADNALRSEYWKNDGVVGEGDVNAKVTVGENASLTLNGNVSGYAGDFVQNGGTVTVNAKDGKFFGGAVEVLGGKLTAENADWNVTKQSVLNGDVTLGNVSAQGNLLQVKGGKFAAKSLHLTSSTIENDADFTFFGNDENESVLDSATLKVKNLTLDGRNGKGIDDGAFIDVHEDSKLIVTGDLTLTDKTLLSGSAKTVHAQNLFLENGSWYYDEDLSDSREFQVGDGILTLRGGQIITSPDGGNVNDTANAPKIESLLLKKSSDAVFSDPVAAYIEAGTYDFKKGVTIADNDSEMRIKGDNTVVNIGALAVNGGSFVIGVDGDKASDKPLVTVKTISIADGAKMELISGTLNTTTDQIFKNSLGADGKTIDVGSQIYADDKLALTGGTLAFSDAFYNSLYAQSAANTLNEKSTTTLVFNGERVDAPQGTVDIDQIGDNKDVVESNVTVKVDADETGTANIDKSFGVSRIELSEKVKDILIKAKDTAEKIIKLVGSGDADGELISGENLETVAVGENATLQLGQSGSSNNQGQISSALTVEENGTLAVAEGTYKLADVTAKKGKVNVDAGKVTFDKLTADEGSINISDGASVAVANLKLQGDSQIAAGKNLSVTELVLDTTAEASHEITGTMSIDKLGVTGDQKVTLNIGTEGENGARGDLTVKGGSLKGLSFFLDPAYVDGQTIADGSRLVFAGDTIDGKVAVGQNSYVVLGGTDDSAVTAVFNEGKVTWGNADGAVLAAAYVAKPITIDSTTGGLLVDGTLTSSQDVTAGSVTFAANSALVADVTNVTDGTALITADNVSVAEGSKAVLVGTLRQGTTYMLTSDADANLNWADNLVAGNALWKLTMNDDGKISTKLTDASVIFGSSMQGTALANAGMEADNDYVNKLLTDESGNIANLGNTAARFDAAMNAAGALTTFTTVYDRASDLRQIVREEAVKGEGNRLWARVTGGKTKLKGISTGGTDLHTKTNAYGLVIGGEAELSSVTLGAAFTAGTGDTKNSAVSGKDDFDFYGLSVYGTTTLGSVDVLADASVNVLKSDLTVGGVADVDTDVTTSVYSFGVQGQKTFALDVADITPFIGANVYHVRGGSYSNGHGAHVASSNATAVEFPIGAKVSKDFETAAGMKVAPAFSLAVVPTVGNRDIDSKVKFAGAQSTYNYTFTDDVKVRTKLGVDATSGNFNFGLQAGYEWGNEERSSASVEARLKYMF